MLPLQCVDGRPCSRSTCRNGDESKAYLIAHSEKYLSQGDAVVNGYREGQDVVCAL